MKEAAPDQRLIDIGDKLKKLRIQNGYTSYENFALDHDLNRKYYWSVEKGRNISIAYLLKILDIHKVSLEQFINLKTPPKPQS